MAELLFRQPQVPESEEIRQWGWARHVSTFCLLSNFRIRFFLEKFRQIALRFQKQPVSKTKQAIIQLGIPTL